jgi:hypothetical protein
MLNGAYAKFGRSTDCLRRMTMSRYIRPGARCLLYRRANLFVGILAALQRVGWRSDSARGHDLYVRRASPQFLAHGSPHCVRAVRHHCHGICVTATATHHVVEAMISGPEVSVTAGLADDATAVKQPRHALQQSVPYGLRKAHIGAAHIPHGCESAIQAGMQKRCGVVRKVGHRSLRQPRKVQSSKVDVDVRVNQAWHEHSPATIDDFCIRMYGGGAGNYIFDRRACDHHFAAFDKPIRIAVENARSAKDDPFGVAHE